MTVRRLPLAVGVLALAAGIVLALGVVPSPSVPASLGFVAIVLVGAVLGGAAILGRAARGPTSDPLPAPGAGGTGRVPGDEVDRLLATIASIGAADSAAVVDRLERVAVATIAREAGCSPETARERLSEGTWTDDETAAAFFATGAPRPTVRERFRGVVRGESTRRRRAERAIDALYRLAEGE